ncbi:MAG: radical SAM protein [Firmicutes bacterium]|nr:radical SAM protein [Bacillota bacterium]
MKEISELRIQVTAKNQFPRLYDPALFSEDKSEMSIETAVAVAKAAVALGITKIRLTGGEPMEHSDILGLVKAVRDVEGIERLSMTTNGTLFPGKAKDLKEAGLDSVDVLLDTFSEEKYIYLTGGAPIDETMDALEAGVKTGMKPVRIQATILEGINDTDILNFGQFTLNEPVDVVFLERENRGEAPEGEDGKKIRFMPTEAVKKKFKGMVKIPVSDPLIEFGKWYEGQGRIGFIDLERAAQAGAEVTAVGMLKRSLRDEEPADIREAVESGDPEQIRTALEAAL